MSQQQDTVSPSATPDWDALQSDTRTEDQLLDAILRKSEFTQDAMESLPEEQAEVPAPSEANDEGDDLSSEVDNEVTEDDIEEVEESEDDTSTQEDTIYTLDDLDDFQVAVKIDGEESSVSISELVKSYQTEQHLSNKGRELGDARKALDEERASKLSEIDSIVNAAEQTLMKAENMHAKEYHSYTEDIKIAREDGDTTRLTELKDKQELAAEKYYAAQKDRKEMVETANKNKAEIETQAWNAKLEAFGKQVNEIIPGWNEDMAGEIREFALSRKISEEVIGQMIDPYAIKALNDLRISETAKKKGVQKREKAPVRAVPVKKSRPAEEKKAEAENAQRNKVLSGEGSKAEEQAFLRSMAARHFE